MRRSNLQGDGMNGNVILGWIGGIVGAVTVLFLTLVVWQNVRVYIAETSVEVQQLEGEAMFKRAEFAKQIMVEQAKAEEDSAQYRANAIGIVGQAAKDYPEYRYQEFLGSFAEALNDGNIDKIVFIPTEANIPITEAGRTTN